MTGGTNSPFRIYIPAAYTTHSLQSCRFRNEKIPDLFAIIYAHQYPIAWYGLTIHLLLDIHLTNPAIAPLSHPRGVMHLVKLHLAIVGGLKRQRGVHL